MGNSEKKKRREKEVRRQAGILKNLRAQAGPAVAITTQPPPATVIKGGCSTPQSLVVVGPMVSAVWSVPAALAEALKAQGRPVPPPVAGIMLVDTGATGTCIAKSVADQLQLKATGLTSTYGAGGKHSNEVYEAHLELSFGDGANGAKLRADRAVLAIPQLADHGQALGIQMNGQQTTVVGLLGRDFLRHTRFIYDGHTGRFEIHLQPHTLKSAASPAAASGA